MTTDAMTLNEIRRKGCEALIRELGPVGYIRFIQQFSLGHGDFTADRRTFIDQLTPDTLRALVEQQQ